MPKSAAKPAGRSLVALGVLDRDRLAARASADRAAWKVLERDARPLARELA